MRKSSSSIFWRGRLCPERVGKFDGLWFILAVMVLVLPSVHGRERFNGFDVSNSSVPISQIRGGGPGRDGIPAIDRPRFITPEQVLFLSDDDQVLSVTIDGKTRAYPLRILVWHEIVNDKIDKTPIAVTYCPLCGTGMVFSRQVDGKEVDFGVSGLLYQSDMLMYDRQTESLWSQLEMTAIAGKKKGSELTWLPSSQMRWKAWRREHPEGKVLSTQTGHRRDYTRMPYAGYEDTERTMFPVPSTRKELRNKAWVAGIVIDDEAAAYSLASLKQKGAAEDFVGGVAIRVTYEEESGAVRVTRKDSSEELPVVNAYWFAWQAFYPETKLWTSP